MIDLRSDTLTLPDRPMLETILTAKLGDDGRADARGRGEDLAVNELEDLAAEITGKEEAVLFPSGTMANTAAILTYCRPGDGVLVDEIQHIFITEKVVFDRNFGRLTPLFYKLNGRNVPDLESMTVHLRKSPVSLVCVENTHNFSGGFCMSPEEMGVIKNAAESYGVPVHMDGARLFNAAAALGVAAADLCAHADSVMFCISKGLGAPVGSLLCGTREFIRKARLTRKLLGGNMRQAGIIAAPGIYALRNNIVRLGEDNENARYTAEKLRDLRRIKVQAVVQSNILMLDMSGAGVSPEDFCARAKARGLWIRPVIGSSVRLVFYKGIDRKDAEGAAGVIKEIDASL